MHEFSFRVEGDVWYRPLVSGFVNLAIAMAIKAVIVVYIEERRLRLLASQADRAAAAKQAKDALVPLDGLGGGPHGLRAVKGRVLQDTIKTGDVAKE